MELNELLDSLEIVFEKEEAQLRNEGSYTFYFEGSTTEKLNYPNSDILLQLYAEAKNDEFFGIYFATKILDFLRKNLIESKEKIVRHTLYTEEESFFGISTSCLSFYTLLRLGYTDDAIASLKERKESCYAIYVLLQKLLAHTYFDPHQLKELQLFAKENRGYDIEEKLRYKIIQTRFQQLETRIKKVNIEINQDKKNLSEKISILKLSGNYNDLLNYMDSFILGDNSEVVNAGMINNLRTFMANLQKEIANKIAELEDEKIPHIDGRGEMGDIRGYLKDKLELTDADDKLITSFIDILHKEGGHSFMSEKEYFRLSRNIAIEIALFVLSKYENEYIR